jgi:hypothetical protein
VKHGAYGNALSSLVIELIANLLRVGLWLYGWRSLHRQESPCRAAGLTGAWRMDLVSLRSPQEEEDAISSEAQ